MEKAGKNTLFGYLGRVLNEFLWTCAGVNKRIIRQCPTEYAKYAGMGGTIFFTACMAALSGGYAISTVFDDTRISCVFGLFWGFLIFNLDRLIVNTMYSDGKVTISWKEFWSGLPRIVMAIFLGIVISTPLELKIYEKSINTEIKDLKEKKLKELLASDEAKLEELTVRKEQILSRDVVDVAAGGAGEAYNSNSKELLGIQAEYNKLQAQINRIVIQRKQISQIDNPSQYNNLSNQIHSLSAKRNALRPQITKLQAEIAGNNKDYRDAVNQNSLQKRKDLESIDKDIDAIKIKIDDAEKIYRPQLSDEFDGFQGRMMAFSSLKENESTKWAAFFISLLFIIVECAPTFMRMMVADGSYEEILEAEKHKIRVMASKRISDLNDEINTEVKISTEKNSKRLELELQANKELMEKLSKTHAELLQIALDKWREEELKKINKDPSSFIKIEGRS